MTVTSRYNTTDGGATGESGNISVYFPTLNTSISPDLLTTNDTMPASEGFDYSVTVQGASGSAAAFSKALLVAVDGDVASTTDISTTDLMFMGNFANISNNFFTSNSSKSDLKDSYILATDSIFPSTNNSNVTLGEEYVAYMAYLYIGDARGTSLFNNSQPVVDAINGSNSEAKSIVNAIDTVFNSTASETTLVGYNTIIASASTYKGDNAAVIAYEVIATYAPTRLDANLSGVTLQSPVAGNTPTNVVTGQSVYQIPLIAGDIVQLGVTMNIPSGQFSASGATPNPNVSVSSYKVLINLVLA